MSRDEIPVDELTEREREAYDRGFAHGTRDREDGRGRVLASFRWSSEHEHGRIERRGYRDARTRRTVDAPFTFRCILPIRLGRGEASSGAAPPPEPNNSRRRVRPMDTKDTKKPTLAEAVSAWAAASYALTVAANVRGCITDTSGLAPAWWRHGQRLRREAWSLMEGAISGRSRNAIPGLDYGMTGRIFDPYSGSGGLGPAEILARGELLAAGVQNAEAIGELVLEWREEDRTRAQKLADVTFSMEAPAANLFGIGGSDDYVDPTMTPEEFGAYREQEEDAKERESWSAEQDAAWIDDTDSLPTVPDGFDAFDPAAALEGRGDAAADDTTHEEDTDR